MSEDSESEATQSLPLSRAVFVAGVTVIVLCAGIASPLIAPVTAESGVHVTLNPTRDTVDPGETIQVGVTVRNDADTESPAPVLTVDTLPTGWTVESWAGTEASYRNSTNEWLWTTIEPGETIKFTITVSVPADATGEETIGVALSDGENRSAATDTTLTVRETATGDEGNNTGEGDAQPVIVEVPGFSFQVTLLAILIVGGILSRKSSQ